MSKDTSNFDKLNIDFDKGGRKQCNFYYIQFFDSFIAIIHNYFLSTDIILSNFKKIYFFPPEKVKIISTKMRDS